MKTKLKVYRRRMTHLVRWWFGPRRRIKELRVDLAAVMRYNIGLANENYRLRTELNGLGQELIAEICKQGMFAVRHPDPEEAHVFVWAGNAEEQLECVVAKFLSPNAASASTRFQSERTRSAIASGSRLASAMSCSRVGLGALTGWSLLKILRKSRKGYV